MAIYDREEELAALKRAFEESGYDGVLLYGQWGWGDQVARAVPHNG